MRGYVRGGAVAVAVAVAGVLGVCLTGCSGTDSAVAHDRRETYCGRLGAWQQARNAGDGGDGIAGIAVVAASKPLDRDRLDTGGSHVLTDTALAVEGDPQAEGRVVAYCDAVGFETLTR
ncbi:hypothetical protein [Streptomyces sp. CRN 30]|uniref:hypothetical protein n=1 Tax=Streptomyces sp. CRN 30 TaxID=3075613 RepID=UPI002A8379D1|nr:hypothetical protein [Streptomyces sp. CRN 30]